MMVFRLPGEEFEHGNLRVNYLFLSYVDVQNSDFLRLSSDATLAVYRRAELPGCTTVRGMVKAEPRETLLPPDLFNRFINDDVLDRSAADPYRAARRVSLLACKPPSLRGNWPNGLLAPGVPGVPCVPSALPLSRGLPVMRTTYQVG